MRRRVIIIATLLLAACDFGKHNIPGPLPTEIEGLELKFTDTGLSVSPSDIEFTSETTGFLSTLKGGIFKTSNSGATWSEVRPESDLPIWDLLFISDNEGWAVGGSGVCPTPDPCTPEGAIILHTINGGETWTQVPLETQSPVGLYSIWFVNDQLGFATGSYSVLRTLDGGATWTETVFDVTPGSNAFMNVCFFDEDHGIVSGNFNTVYTTSDGGDKWDAFEQGEDFRAFSISINGDGKAVCSADTQLYQTTDYGKTWSPLHKFTNVSIFSVNFVSENMGFVFGPGESSGTSGNVMAALYYTKDGGQTWTGTGRIFEAPTITRASFPTPNVAYGMGFKEIVRITF